MIGNRIEAAKLTNLANSPQRKDCGCGSRKKTVNPRSGKRNFSNSDLFQIRVSKALKKAAAVRTRQLRRPLTTSEWTTLKRAVKKQCRTISTDTVSRSLRQLAQRINVLENACPQDSQQLQNSIGMFSLQVSALREQALRHLNEQDDVRATCPHLRMKRAHVTADGKGARFFVKFPNIGYVSYIPQNRLESLACPKCTQARADFVFLWSGQDFQTFEQFTEGDPISHAVIDACRLRGIHPLSLQEVWNSVLTSKFGNLD